MGIVVTAPDPDTELMEGIYVRDVQSNIQITHPVGTAQGRITGSVHEIESPLYMILLGLAIDHEQIDIEEADTVQMFMTSTRLDGKVIVKFENVNDDILGAPVAADAQNLYTPKGIGGQLVVEHRGGPDQSIVKHRLVYDLSGLTTVVPEPAYMVFELLPDDVIHGLKTSKINYGISFMPANGDNDAAITGMLRFINMPTPYDDGYQWGQGYNLVFYALPTNPAHTIEVMAVDAHTGEEHAVAVDQDVTGLYIICLGDNAGDPAYSAVSITIKDSSGAIISTDTYDISQLDLKRPV